MVTVTGEAFSSTLTGIVTRIDRQASLPSNPSNPMSLFHVYVEMRHLKKSEQHTILMGMSAYFHMDIHHDRQILLPIAAVFPKNNHEYVTTIDAKTGRLVNKPIVTGPTTFHNVTVLKGLQPGEKILVYHQPTPTP